MKSSVSKPHFILLFGSAWMCYEVAIDFGRTFRPYRLCYAGRAI